MSAWTILCFPEFILGVTLEQIKTSDKHIYDVYLAAANFIASINDLLISQTSENYLKYIGFSNNYTNCFETFLQKDKIIKIQDLAAQWLVMGQNIDLIDKSDKYTEDHKNKCKIEIEHTRKSIIFFIKKIAPDFDIHELIKYETLQKHTTIIMSIAYKNLFYKDLTEKIYNTTTQILHEIRAGLLILNKKLEVEFEDTFNINFILTRHKNDVLSYDDIVKIGDYLVEIIKTLESPVSESDTIKKWENILCSYTEDNKLIVDLFIFILDEIEDIKQNIINVHTLASLNLLFR